MNGKPSIPKNGPNLVNQYNKIPAYKPVTPSNAIKPSTPVNKNVINRNPQSKVEVSKPSVKPALNNNYAKYMKKPSPAIKNPINQIIKSNNYHYAKENVAGPKIVHIKR